MDQDASLTNKRLYCGGPGISIRGLVDSSYPGPPAWCRELGKRVVLTHQGRVAIDLACDVLGLRSGDEVLAPAYNCGSEIDPLLARGLRVRLYRVDRECRIDLDSIQRAAGSQTRAVYIIHYFGWPQELEDLKSWCRNQRIRLIEDCALALFSRGANGAMGRIGDVTVFSLAKSLGVPDGGALAFAVDGSDRIGRLRPPPPGCVLRSMLPLLKSTVLRAAVPRSLQRILEMLNLRPAFRGREHRMIGDHPAMPAGYYFTKSKRSRGISSISVRLLWRVHPKEVIARRRANFQVLLSGLDRISGLRPLFTTLPDGVCPLAMPLVVENRDNWCRALRTMGIDAVAWWAGYHAGLRWAEFPDAVYLKDHVMTIPVHQDLDKEHISYILECIWRIRGRTGEGKSGSLAGSSELDAVCKSVDLVGVGAQTTHGAP